MIDLSRSPQPPRTSFSDDTYIRLRLVHLLLAPHTIRGGQHVFATPTSERDCTDAESTFFADRL